MINPRRCVALLMAAVLLGAAPAGARAQGAPPDSARTDRGEGGRLSLGGADDVALTLGGYVQVDSRWLSGTASGEQDGMLLRRARLVFDAEMPNGWQLRLQPDFGQGRVLVQDAFVGHRRRAFTARAGRFRPAFGTERMQGSASLLFPERSVVNGLMPSRSFGAQATWARHGFTISLGGFRTPVGTDVPTIDTDGDVNARGGTGHDLLTRAAWSRERRGRYLELQASLLSGRERGSAEAPGVSRILSVAQQPMLAFRDDETEAGTVVAAGARERAAVGGVVGTRRLMLGLEAAHLGQQVAYDGRTSRVSAQALSLRMARVWGGTRTAAQEVVPSGPRGAVDIGVRAGAFRAQGDELDALITRRSSRDVRTAGVAVGWVPTRLTRLAMSVDITRAQDGRRPLEQALVMRVQQGF